VIKIFIGTKRLKENFRGTKTKMWYIYRDQKHICYIVFFFNLTEANVYIVVRS